MAESKKKSQNDIKRNRILFDFESVIDLKLSCIKADLIKSGKIILNDNQLDEFKFARMEIYEDPLIHVTHKELTEDLDHPEYPVTTGMLVLIKRYLESNGIINPTVLCKDAIQERIIKKLLPDVKVLVAPRNKVKCLNFARIVLADQRHTLEFRDPLTVNFVVLNFRECFSQYDNSLFDEDILIKIGDVNELMITRAYPEIPEPVG